MEEKDDIFRFEDFLGGDKIEDLKRMKSNLLNEGLFNEDEELEDEEEVDPKFNPYKTSFENDDDVIKDFDLDEDDILKRMKGYGWGDLTGIEMEEFENSDDYDGTKDSTEYAEQFNEYLKKIAFNSDSENDDYLEESKSEYNRDDYYKLFKDKSEDFICDIAVEGVSQSDTEVRLIVESEDWTLMFTGEIKNGKCIIPIKKLNILNEGQTGNIKLEVNADGNLFTPWEDKYIVKVSKKVTVSLNENKSNTKSKKPVKKGLGVKVNVKR